MKHETLNGTAGTARQLKARIISPMHTAKTGQLSIHAHTYRIAGNFRERKLSQICEKYDFRWENFRGLLAFAVQKDATPQISQRKLSCIATKLRKFYPSKVFRYTIQHMRCNSACEYVVVFAHYEQFFFRKKAHHSTWIRILLHILPVHNICLHMW